MLLFDVDRFKLVNDSLGHDHGDQLLIAIANSLRATLGPGEALARFGSDAFAVVIVTPIADGPHAGRTYTRRLQTDWSSTPIVTSRRSASASSSPDRADSRSRCCRRRDHDVSVKEKGHDRAEWFDPSLHRDVVASFEVERELRGASSTTSCSSTSSPVSTSRPARLPAAGHSSLAPPSAGRSGPTLIPVAEDTGLIVALGRWVMYQALASAADWPERVQSR